MQMNTLLCAKDLSHHWVAQALELLLSTTAGWTLSEKAFSLDWTIDSIEVTQPCIIVQKQQIHLCLCTAQCTQLTAISFCLSWNSYLFILLFFTPIIMYFSFINCMNIWIHFLHWLCKCIIQSSKAEFDFSLGAVIHFCKPYLWHLPLSIKRCNGSSDDRFKADPD